MWVSLPGLVSIDIRLFWRCWWCTVSLQEPQREFRSLFIYMGLITGSLFHGCTRLLNNHCSKSLTESWLLIQYLSRSKSHRVSSGLFALMWVSLLGLFSIDIRLFCRCWWCRVTEWAQVSFHSCGSHFHRYTTLLTLLMVYCLARRVSSGLFPCIYVWQKTLLRVSFL